MIQSSWPLWQDVEWSGVYIVGLAKAQLFLLYSKMHCWQAHHRKEAPLHSQRCRTPSHRRPCTPHSMSKRRKRRHHAGEPKASILKTTCDDQEHEAKQGQGHSRTSERGVSIPTGVGHAWFGLLFAQLLT